MARDVGAARPPPPETGSSVQNLPRQNLPTTSRSISPDRLQYSSTESESEQSPESREELYSEQYSEEEEQSEELYRAFLNRRLEQQNMSLEQPREQQRRRTQSRNYMQNEPLHGDLATLAERFSRSEGRDQVRQRAEEIDLSSLNSENFQSLLSELFQDGGITQERVLVLFFFCSDLTIRACRSGLASMTRCITTWTLSFLRRTVAGWVRIQGGWARVLQGRSTRSDRLLVLGSTAVAVVALGYLLYRR